MIKLSKISFHIDSEQPLTKHQKVKTIEMRYRNTQTLWHIVLQLLSMSSSTATIYSKSTPIPAPSLGTRSVQRDLVMGLHPIRHWCRCGGNPFIFLLLIRI